MKLKNDGECCRITCPATPEAGKNGKPEVKKLSEHHLIKNMEFQ